MKNSLLRFPIYSLVVVVLFSLLGCTGLQPLPANDSGFFRNKAQACLNGEAQLQDITVLNQNHVHLVVIKLKVAPEREEELCLKLLKAITSDASAPAYDKYCVAADQTRSVSFKRQMQIAVLRGLITGLAGIQDSVVIPSQEEVLTFSCFLTRDALNQGSEPTIVVRNGFFRSGPYAGQSTDSLWLKENKINLPKMDNP